MQDVILALQTHLLTVTAVTDLVGTRVWGGEIPPKQIANHISEVLVLAGVNPDGSMRLLQPDAEVELGARVR